MSPADNVSPIIDVGAGTVTFDIDSSADVVDCTYRNRVRGRIEIEKQTDPAGGTGFGFTSNLPGPNDVFSLDDNGQQNANNLLPGSYQVTEDDPRPGYDLTNLVCTDPSGGTTTSLLARRASIDLAPGETVHCTYTNTRRGRIEIEKQTDPAGGTGFGFTSNLPGPNDVFSLDDNGQQNANNLLPGSYQVTEDDPRPGYDLTNLVCTDPSGGTTTSLLARRASIDLAPGETVHCTYTNTRRGRIEIEKQTDPAGGTGFGFTSNLPGPNDVFSLDDNGQQNANNLLPGSYQVTEDDPRPGYDLTNLVCTDPSGGTTTSLLARRASIDLAPGETVHCTYRTPGAAGSRSKSRPIRPAAPASASPATCRAPTTSSRSTTTGSRTPTTCSRAPIRSPRTTRGRAMTSRTWSAPIPPAGPPPRCSPAGPASTWPPARPCTAPTRTPGAAGSSSRRSPTTGTGRSSSGRTR